MIIDSHCHLDSPKLYDQLDIIVKRAEDNDVKCLLTICTTLESFEKIKLITKKYQNIYGTFGIHPHESKNYLNVNAKYINEIVKKNEKIIGIGETGLDFYYNHSDKNIQKKCFIEHIKSAIELNIPLIVHTRNAEQDTYEILKSEKKNSDLKVLVHCFTGTKHFAKKLIDIDCFISVSGIITFNNTAELADSISSIPLKNLLIETDAPYLAPLPYRGKLNEPSFIIHTLKKLSEIKNTSIETVTKYTCENFYNLFNLT